MKCIWGKVKLTLCVLSKNFSRQHFFQIFFIFFLENRMILHANCLLRRQFAWCVISYFLGKICIRASICCLLNLPIAWQVLGKLNVCWFLNFGRWWIKKRLIKLLLNYFYRVLIRLLFKDHWLISFTVTSVTGLHRGGDSGEEVAEILMTSPYRSGKEKTTSPRFWAIFETYFRFCLRRWVGFLLVYSRHWQLL